MTSSWWTIARPISCFRAVVSAGTYVRALARDLGNQLGVGAHLTALRREAIGSLGMEDAVQLEQLGPAALLARNRCFGSAQRRSRRGRAESGGSWTGGEGQRGSRRAGKRGSSGVAAQR